MTTRYLFSCLTGAVLGTLGFSAGCSGASPVADSDGSASDPVGTGGVVVTNDPDGAPAESVPAPPTAGTPAATQPMLITLVEEPSMVDEPDTATEEPPIDPCVLINCEFHQHCEAIAGIAACQPNTCEQLACDRSKARCEEVQGGAVCRDITCSADVDCAASEFCDGQRCQEDVCMPNDTMCEAGAVLSCEPNGSGLVEQFACASGSPYFASECSAAGNDAGCGCEGDWDCPQFTACEVGKCVGTGVEPTCSLPPADFAQDTTQPEITWGGADEDSSDAEGSPYPAFSQVVMTPVVANLNDDNADGLINERDVPEIIFLSFRDRSFRANGMLRAIHGGSAVRTLNGESVVTAERGDDYFAVCNADTDKRWLKDEGFVGGENCSSTEPVLDPTGGVAVGDIDYDGVPEIVVTQEQTGGNTAIYVFSNTGALVTKSEAFFVLDTGDPRFVEGQNPAPTLANMDAKGHVEVVVGRWVFQLGTEPDADGNPSLVFTNRFEGSNANGANGQGPISCVANVIDDGDGAVQELIAGTSAYSLPDPPAGVTRQSDAACDDGEFCQGKLVLRWDAEEVNPAGELPSRNGFCAVADVLGVDAAAAPGPLNPLDGIPEVVSVMRGYVVVMNGQTGEVLRSRPIIGAGRGGPPNVDDFDGDGFPEVGLAGRSGYVVADFQPPSASCPEWPSFDDRGSQSQPRSAPDMSCDVAADCGDEAQFGCNTATRSCVCLHNGWAQRSQDASSEVTGSSVFDFNGDGAAEVIYNDECHFRVYDGTSGDVLIEKWSESRTRTEYPVVADVDRDGNAEIVFSTSNESGFCTRVTTDAPRDQFNNGIEVWGDVRDLWVPARGIWNQHAYHVTNVTEGGTIPRSEPESWKPLNGRLYNTYRSNPRNFGVAPDLVVTGVQVTSPDASCGTLGTRLNITADVANQGDLLVGGEVLVGLYGKWGNGDFEPLLDAAGQPLRVALGASLEARQSRLLTVTDFDPANNGQAALPDVVRAVVDDTGIETECMEDNNTLDRVVVPAEQQPDLRLALTGEADARCPETTVSITVSNDATVDANDVEVGIYFGDPTAGGTLVRTVPLNEEVPAGGQVTVQVDLDVPRATTLFGVVDPRQLVPECDDANNQAQGPEVTGCRRALTR